MSQETSVITRHRIAIQEPPMYKVLVHNDDYTPMEFVVDLLKRLFRKDDTTAHRIMLEVHETGVGVGGVYTQDVAETKAAQAHSLARSQEYPLRCSVELDAGGSF